MWGAGPRMPRSQPEGVGLRRLTGLPPEEAPEFEAGGWGRRAGHLNPDVKLGPLDVIFTSLGLRGFSLGFTVYGLRFTVYGVRFTV